MEDNNFNFQNYAESLKKALDLVEQKQIDDFFSIFESYLGSNSNIYLLGNGGSQANAHHISGDFMKTFSLAGLKLKISCLADNVCHLTAASNDISYEEIYSTQIKTKGNNGDLLIALSGSGNSKNIINAVKASKTLGVKSYAIIGYDGGICRDEADEAIHFKINDMQIAKDCQLIVGHICMQFLNTHKPI